MAKRVQRIFRPPEIFRAVIARLAAIMQQDNITACAKRPLPRAVNDDCANFRISRIGLQGAGYPDTHLFCQRI